MIYTLDVRKRISADLLSFFIAELYIFEREHKLKAHIIAHRLGRY